MCNLSEIRKFERVILWLSEQVPENCKCNKVKYCECSKCEEHREKTPLNYQYVKKGGKVEEWLEKCECEGCKIHREAENLKCYPCTQKEKLREWLNSFEDVILDAKGCISAAYNRISKRLSNWEQSKFKDNVGHSGVPYQTQKQTSARYDDNEEDD